EFGVHAFFELADRPHYPVGAQQLLPGQSLPLRRFGHVLLLTVDSRNWYRAGAVDGRLSRPRRALSARTADTSTQRGPSARSRTAGRSPGSNVSSRSPSTAMTPARASTGWTDPGRIHSMSRTPTGWTSPGAMGARIWATASGARRAVTPRGSCRVTGDNWPRMLDKPITSGSA